jgi:hypothetical protein
MIPFSFRQLIGSIQGAVNPGTPVTSASSNFNTPMQASDPSKPAFVSITVDINQVVNLITTQTEEIELRIGPVAAGLADGKSGQRMAGFKKSVKGVSIALGFEVGQGGQLCTILPKGWFYCVRRISGTGATFTTGMVQPLTSS